MVQPQLSVPLMSFAPEAPASWQPLLDSGRAADAAGVDRVVVSDHVVFGENLDAYGSAKLGGQAGGRQPTGPDGHWLEPLTFLSVLAGGTSRVRLGTNILLAAIRRPVVLAKSAATLDVLSGGRLDLGVGVGWQREEYEAAGLDFNERGELLDLTLQACQTFWREQRAQLDHPRLSFEAIHMMPKPAQPGGVPFWVSGTVNPRVVRRLARFGSGWIPWGDAAADVTASIPRMREALSAAGRDPSDLQIVGHVRLRKADGGGLDLDRTMDQVPALRDAGVTDFRLSLPPTGSYDHTLDQMGTAVAAFRDAAGVAA